MTAATTTSPRWRAAQGTRQFPILGLGELAFAAISLATVIGFRRVFLGSEWFLPLVLHAVAAHVTVTLSRRRRLPAVLAIGLSALVALVFISWIHAGQATTFGVPTFATIDALTTSVTDAFSLFSDVKAPTEPLEGFLVATAVAIWASAIIGDWAAFRADATVEAVLPAAALFGVAAVLGADVDRIAVTGIWIGAVLAFVVVRRADRLGRSSTWVGERRSRGPRTLVVLGGALAVAATVVAAVIGPRLPGAEAEAVVSLTDLGDDGPGTRVTVSPLVDIRSRLVQQANVEVFTVRSEVRAYWRLTSLDEFDGTIWKSNGSYGKSSGDLDDGVPVASDRITFDQRFEVSALSQIWLPAAYEPQAVDVEQAVRYDEVSGTLIVDTEVPTSDGTSYGVRSALPQHRPEALAGATPAVPADIAERYLGLPDDFSPAVAQLTQQITAGSANAYEASRRLQDWFRENFTYDLEVALDHSIGDVESFLFEARAGYCEQFAGSFAAMARSLGIPARVAVGFTPGVADPDDPTLFRVRGEHAHAWPEVYLGEYGWVAFEPTPGRGAPFAEQYTGVPEQQVTSGGDPSTATTTPAPPSTEAPSPDASIPDLDVPDFGEQDPDFGTGGSRASEPSPWPGRIAVVAAALVATVALYLALVLAVGAYQRAARRRRATTPSSQVALAWDESLAAVRRVGVPVRRSATQSQAAAQIAGRIPTAATPIRTLAAAVERAAFAPAPPDEDAGTQALVLADEIGDAARHSIDARERFRTRFDPRQIRDRRRDG